MPTCRRMDSNCPAVTFTCAQGGIILDPRVCVLASATPSIGGQQDIRTRLSGTRQRNRQQLHAALTVPDKSGECKENSYSMNTPRVV